MREIRTSGSEGGGAGYSTGPPYPYGICRPPGWFRGLLTVYSALVRPMSLDTKERPFEADTPQANTASPEGGRPLALLCQIPEVLDSGRLVV